MRKIVYIIIFSGIIFWSSHNSFGSLFFSEIRNRATEKFSKDTINKDSTLLLNEMSVMEKHLRGLVGSSNNNIDTSKFVLNDTFPATINEYPDEYLEEDETWYNLTSYFSVWDENKVNPYKIDPCVFRDTLDFILFDSVAFKSISGDSALDDVNSILFRGVSLPTEPTSKSSGFGFRGIRFHSGIDLRLNKGEPVYAVFDGIVRIISKDRRGYGNFVVIRHYNGLETLYGHLNFSVLNKGQEVKAGELLGYGGNTGRSTGPHLHFEVRYQGNSIDPELLIDFNANTLKSNRFTLIPAHFAYAIEKKKRVYYTIKKGNTLSGISRKYKVPVYTLCRLNNIKPKKVLRIGKKIRIR